MKRVKILSNTFMSVACGLILTTVTNGQGLISQWSNTITNPAPEVADVFGVSVTAVGEDLVLVGAHGDRTGPSQGGSAFLLSASGTTITIFTNPAPTMYDVFGSSVAALGSDRVIVSDYQDQTLESYVGAIYVFNTNGSLLKSIRSPIPESNDLFGLSVSALADSKILVGAPTHGEGYAFLLDTNGSLLATFSDPLADSGAGSFGEVIAPFGDVRVVVSDPRAGFLAGMNGAVHLFNIDEMLLTTITNPVPESRGDFGKSVSSVGTSGILVGDPFSSILENDDGVAYYYDTNGVLLTTFTNPYPATIKHFGGQLTSFDDNHVIISATLPPGYSTDLPGKAFLFHLNGTLLAELENPMSAAGDHFGSALAVSENGRVYVGSFADNTGADLAGVVNAFNIVHVGPEIRLIRNPSEFQIHWESETSDWMLQESVNIGQSILWNDSLRTVETNDPTNTVTIPSSEVSGSRYFRLREGE